MQGLPETGDILDDTYVIDSMLGQGGFGAVYLGRQMSMDRKVAIKILVTHALRVDEMTERFRREVMAVRNLSHPNTIRVYDFHENGDEGFLYYVMEYIKGPTLKDIIEKGPMPEDRVVHIVQQILKSLSEAHAQNIVHRDLKPANIMLADLYGETDFVKVVDFGIAKIVGESEEDEEDPLTNAGVLVGTLRYMSPEQITGRGIGPRSDLYALALVAVEMLTGESVFVGTGRWEVLHKQISDDPVEIDPAVAATPLGKILEKALSKDPDARFQSAEEMVEAIEALGEKNPEIEQPVSSLSLPTPEPAAAIESPEKRDGSDANAMAELPQPATQSSGNTGVIAQNDLGFQPSRVAETTDTFGQDLGDKPLNKNRVFIALTLALLATFIGISMFGNLQSSDDSSPSDAALTSAEKPEIPATTELPDDQTGTLVAQEEKPASVRIVAEPVVAEVFEANVLLGSTPLDVELVDGDARRVTLRSDGYRDHEVTLTSNSQEVVTLTRKEKDLAEQAEGLEQTQGQKSDTPGRPPEHNYDDVRRTNENNRTPSAKSPTKKSGGEDESTSGWVDLAPSKDKSPPPKDEDIPLFE